MRKSALETMSRYERNVEKIKNKFQFSRPLLPSYWSSFPPLRAQHYIMAIEEDFLPISILTKPFNHSNLLFTLSPCAPCPRRRVGEGLRFFNIVFYIKSHLRTPSFCFFLLLLFFKDLAQGELEGPGPRKEGKTSGIGRVRWVWW